MANRPVRRTSFPPGGSVNHWPLSGPVSQWMRTWWLPWSDFLKSTMGQGQFGLVNVMVDEMESGDPEQEREIVTGVASYGKQLGRITAALRVVVDHRAQGSNMRGDLREDEERALQEFIEMAENIAAVKERHMAPTAENVDRFLAGLQRLKERDEERYEWTRNRVWKELFAESDQRHRS